MKAAVILLCTRQKVIYVLGFIFVCVGWGKAEILDPTADQQAGWKSGVVWKIEVALLSRCGRKLCQMAKTAGLKSVAEFLNGVLF